MMKQKTFKALLTGVLMICLVLSIPAGVSAQEPPEEEDPGRVIHISTLDRFLRFAESCRTDSYSQGLTVHLDADLDLSGHGFSGIPYFGGTLEGHLHTISGVDLTASGSCLGLFRYVSKEGCVRNLTVEGNLSPQGSQLSIGGIAGSNAGTLENCEFQGTISGVDRVGGMTGVNELSGLILNCRCRGSVSADHFSGGIAGENYGVIRDCMNYSSVNTSARENAVDIASISLETITGTEAPSTVTDAGGIAGTSIGVIRDCINRGNVGYPHMGYNIGGIAGSQAGYVNGCINYGTIQGRKETGGIVGQFEPVSHIDYQKDTLQILEEQLGSAAAMLNRASYNAQSNMGAVGQGIAAMQDYSDTAREAIHALDPSESPDADTILAAKNALRDSMQGMRTTLSDMGGAVGATAGQLSQDLKAVSGQMNAMTRTIREANENLGIRLSDISDEDTPEDRNGKVSQCRNLGNVSGDLNAGGIAGSIAFENDMDPEDDLKVSGDRSLNFDGSLRAVIRDCENRGEVSARKIHAGGIIGRMTLGLVKDCVSTGPVSAEKAQYVGGIAGCSRGYLRSCSAKSCLSGNRYVGGIAGSGTIVTDCLSMVTIENASEKLGGVLGLSEAPQDEDVEHPIMGNLYMRFSQDPGGIDGISYQGKAEPLSPHRFLGLPNLPEAFRSTTLIFREENGNETRLQLPLGSILPPEQVPQVPQKEGFTGQWQGLDARSRIYFDAVYPAQYIPHRITIRSPQVRSDGRPVLLAEGVFPDMEQIDLTAMDLPALSHRELLEAWNLPEFSQKEDTVLRLHLPEETEADTLRILILREGGTWEEVPSREDASYLIFKVRPGDTGFCVAQVPDYGKILRLSLWGGAGIAALILIPVIRRIRRKKKNASQKEK